MDVSNSTGESTDYRVLGAGSRPPQSNGTGGDAAEGPSIQGSVKPQDFDVVIPPPGDAWVVEFYLGDEILARQVVDSPKASVDLVDEDGEYRVRMFIPTIDAFITNSIGEQKRAKDLEEALRRHGVSTWLDTRRRRLSKIELMKVVQDARNFVVLLGPKIGVAEKQRDEWAFALEAVWQDANKRFIPILLEGAKVPAFIRSAASEERPIVPLRIDDPARDWDGAVASLIRILRSEEDPREAGEPVGITEEDRRRQREWLSYLHELAESFR